MAIIKKKYETFDIDYEKEVGTTNYFIKGTVTVRLADSKISDLNVSLYDEWVEGRENYYNRKGIIHYTEIGAGEDGLSVSGNFQMTPELSDVFSNAIVAEVKEELFA